MAIIITSAGTGSKSLKWQNTSASPQSNYLLNLSTSNVLGDVYGQAVNIQNSNGQVIAVAPLSQLTTVAASTPTSWNLQNAVDAITATILA